MVCRLQKTDATWFAVLLLRSETSGYVLTMGEVRHGIHDRSFELSTDGDFKVNEDSDLEPIQRFQSLGDLLHHIL